MTQPFDSMAEEYDRWYDSPEGRAIFDAELQCLRSLGPEFAGRWLEVGVGSGRFASALGIAEGLDPSPRMLEIAAARGIRPIVGSGEDLPLAAGSLDGILLALTLCFVADAKETLRQCQRVLRKNGKLLVGMINADSSWGSAYAEKAAKGHPVYAEAVFRTAEEMMILTQRAGFRSIGAASTLFWQPGESPHKEPGIEPGIVSGAGFLAFRFACVNQNE